MFLDLKSLSQSEDSLKQDRDSDKQKLKDLE